MILAGSFLLALVVTSLLEYVIHRLMHAGAMLGRRHAQHHRDGWGQGFWAELWTYLLPGSMVILPAWFLGIEIGIGWTAGIAAYAGFIAYAHQLQHDNPAACRWMPMPIHYVHHRDKMWHHNFGMSCDVWDRLFGTYKRVPFGSERPIESERRGALEIQWRGASREAAPH
jgi:sterol desaturase/sphingolipid hydroxylase (fatty acid hydroxylase superfamily)